MASNGELKMSEGRSRVKRSPASSSRSRSRSPRDRKKRARSPSRSASRSTFSRSPSPQTSKRLHVANLDDSVRRRDIEEVFGKFGKLADVWVASYPPFYAFVVYEKGEAATEALREMRNGYVKSCRVSTTIALPRNNSRRMGGPPQRRFYDDYGGDRRRRSPRRSRSPRKSSRRSKSPSKQRRRSRSDSR